MLVVVVVKVMNAAPASEIVVVNSFFHCIPCCLYPVSPARQVRVLLPLLLKTVVLYFASPVQWFLHKTAASERQQQVQRSICRMQ